MMLRMFVAGLVGACLGMFALWEVSTRTDLIYRIQKHGDFKAVNTADQTWTPNQSHRDRVNYFMKPLFSDPSTGEVEMLVRYPAGQINPEHVHQFGHGMYVLQGKLVSNHGTFGPGTFVWFPGGEPVSHGAGPDEDVTVVFTTHDGLKIDYARAPH